jgi:hypothetical protein
LRRHHAGRFRGRLSTGAGAARQAEVQHLDQAARTDHHVAGLHVAVNDAVSVSHFERLGELGADRQGFLDLQGGAREACRQGLSLHQLHHQRGPPAGVLLQAVNARDVGVVERGQRERLATKLRDRVRVAAHGAGQDFERDVTLEPRVVRAIDLAHASGAERGDDLVGPEASADGPWHPRDSTPGVRPFTG